MIVTTAMFFHDWCCVSNRPLYDGYRRFSIGWMASKKKKKLKKYNNKTLAAVVEEEEKGTPRAHKNYPVPRDDCCIIVEVYFFFFTGVLYSVIFFIGLFSSRLVVSVWGGDEAERYSMAI